MSDDLLSAILQESGLDPLLNSDFGGVGLIEDTSGTPAYDATGQQDSYASGFNNDLPIYYHDLTAKAPAQAHSTVETSNLSSYGGQFGFQQQQQQQGFGRQDNVGIVEEGVPKAVRVLRVVRNGTNSPLSNLAPPTSGAVVMVQQAGNGGVLIKPPDLQPPFSQQQTFVLPATSRRTETPAERVNSPSVTKSGGPQSSNADLNSPFALSPIPRVDSVSSDSSRRSTQCNNSPPGGVDGRDASLSPSASSDLDSETSQGDNAPTSVAAHSDFPNVIPSSHSRSVPHHAAGLSNDSMPMLHQILPASSGPAVSRSGHQQHPPTAYFQFPQSTTTVGASVPAQQGPTIVIPQHPMLGTQQHPITNLSPIPMQHSPHPMSMPALSPGQPTAHPQQAPQHNIPAPWHQQPSHQQFYRPIAPASSGPQTLIMPNPYPQYMIRPSVTVTQGSGVVQTAEYVTQSGGRMFPPGTIYAQQRRPYPPAPTLHQDQYMRGIAPRPPAMLTHSMSMPVMETVSGNQAQQQQQQSGMVDDMGEEEELGYAETYADYIPSKLKSGLRHPDAVVETSSMSSVPPPDVSYMCSIPEEIIDTGQISALQLESIVYACQRHETILPNTERAGYLVGDGAGVGKGRIISGIIYENYLLGRKRALWFSVSSDLMYDAKRDLKDIGADKIKVWSFNKFRYAKLSGKENHCKKGVIFATYSSLIGESQSVKGKYRTRLKQLVQWCGKDFDGVIVFDECHRAKNLMPSGGAKSSKTGQTVVELQRLLPKARVVYASATGATEPRNMAYMTRLGLWGEGMPFVQFHDFISSIERRGVGAMEVVAMDMKLRGMYLARQLSFKGVSFRIEEVSSSSSILQAYDSAVELWLEAREKFELAAETVQLETAARKSMWSQFWSAHQRFFKHMCIASKIADCVKMARDAVKSGKCVVIGLQSTGEARTLQQLEEMDGELTDFLSTTKSIMQNLIERHFPVADAAEMVARYGCQNLFAAERARQNSLSGGVGNSDGSSSEGDEEDDDDDDDESSSGEQEDQQSKDASLPSASGKKPSAQQDSSAEEDSDDEPGDERSDKEQEDDEDFNPFEADGEDDDPWAGKQKRLQTPSPTPTPKKGGADDEKSSEKAKPTEGNPDDANAEKAKLLRPKRAKKRKKHRKQGAADGKKAKLSGKQDLPTLLLKKQKSAISDVHMNQTLAMRANLLRRLDALGDRLPVNTLDQLIDDLGGPSNVAEMTGRKGRIICTESGDIQYVLRHAGDVPLEMLNIAERERFMSGEKLVAIISEAASSGISLHADRRSTNQRRRVHITLELPWSADKAIQQFGRTHRSNQVSSPEYVFLISELAGEKRFASVVAKRLESLGALTHGDRRATETRDLSQFNLDTKFGRVALETTIRSIMGLVPAMATPPESYGGDFFRDMREYMIAVGLLNREPKSHVVSMDKESTSMTKFLNRLLGFPVAAQNGLFQYFSETLEAVIAQARREGRYDLGIMDIGHGKVKVRKVESRVFIGRQVSALSFKVELIKIAVERGLAWEDAIEIYCDHQGDDDGFYLAKQSTARQVAVLCTAVNKKRIDSGEKLFNVYRPNTGLNLGRLETIEEIKRKYKRVDPRDAETIWNAQYEASRTQCQHSFLHGGQCKNVLAGLQCEVGLRRRNYYVLSGSVLSVWHRLDAVLASSRNRSHARAQVIRVKTEDGLKIIGVMIPTVCVDELVRQLSDDSARVHTERFNVGAD